MAIRHHAFLDLEDSLTRRVTGHASKVLLPIFRKLRKLVDDKEWHAAHKLVDTISLEGVAAKNLKYVETLGMAALLLGASRISDPKDSSVYRNVPLHQLHNGVRQYAVIVGGNATLALRMRAHLMLAKLETQNLASKHIYKSEKKTLYVMRPLLNADALVAWANSQGFHSTLPAEDMHCTIAFSRQAIDWGLVKPSKDTLTCSSSKGRSVVPLGDKGAIVLKFQNYALTSRWKYFRTKGASWDFESYQPHVTLTYKNPHQIDPEKILPFEGALIFGPEEFSEVVEDWDSDIVEKDDFTQADLQVAGALNPEQSEAPAPKKKKPALVGVEVGKGDVAGHSFHGNQWTGGIGGDQPERSIEEIQKSMTSLMGRGVTFRVNGEYNSLNKATAEQWQSLCPHATPTEIMTALLGDDGSTSLLVREDDQAIEFNLGLRNSSIVFDAANVSMYGVDINSMSREFDFDTGEAHHTFLELPQGSQGGGAVKDMFAAVVPLYQQMGLSSISLGANLDVGGYAWARYGFYGENQSSVNKAAQTAVTMIAKVVAQDDIQAKISIAGLQELQALSKLSRINTLDVLSQLTDAKTPNLDAALRGEFEWAQIKNGTAMKLGLKDTSWEGKLNFDNPDQMRRLWTYVNSKPKLII